ncbi:MAG: hypothetical protein ACI920_003421, partial [Saprospiraceae bacterium]
GSTQANNQCAKLGETWKYVWIYFRKGLKEVSRQTMLIVRSQKFTGF